MKNFGSLECPCCHSKEYVLWGFYERGITYMKQDQIYSETVKIQRIRCKSCGKTHAILPFGIVPYKQLTDEIFLLLFLEKLPSNPFTEETKNSYKKQFFKYHLSCLKTMLQMRNTNKILLLLKEQKEEIKENTLAIYLEDEQINYIPEKDSGYMLDLTKSSCTNGVTIGLSLIHI